jgi:hypothetical protein
MQDLQNKWVHYLPEIVINSLLGAYVRQIGHELLIFFELLRLYNPFIVSEDTDLLILPVG